MYTFRLLRDSKRAGDIDEDLELQEQALPRTREEREAHAALMAQKTEEKKR